MKTTVYYVSEAKRALGDVHMSDRALGEAIGYSQQHVSKAKCGYITDPVAIALAEAIGIDAGEVLLVARAAREPDEVVRGHLMAYAKKALRLVPSRAAGALAALAVALGAALTPDHALARVGGDGRSRP